MKTFFIFEFITLLGATLWGGISLSTIPLGQMGYSSFNLVFLRMSFSLVTTFFIIIFKPKLLKVKPKDLIVFIGMGAGGYMLTSLFNTISILLCGSGVAAMLMNTSPIWLTVFAVLFFNEKPNALKIISLIGVVGGCICLCFGDTLNFSLTGVLVGFLSGLTFALYCFLGKTASNRGYSTLTTNVYIFLFATLSSLPFTNFTQISNLFNAQLNESLTYLILLAVCFTVLPSLLYNLGLKKLTATTAGIIGIVEPLTASIIGFTLFSEPVTPLVIIGIVVVIASLILLQLSVKTQRLSNDLL